MKLTEYPVIIVVWGQEGCPACDEFIPRFRRVAKKWARCVPAVVVDAGAYTDAADSFRVQSTPTTMILRHGRKSLFLLDGATDDASIERLFAYASDGRCQA